MLILVPGSYTGSKNSGLQTNGIRDAGKEENVLVPSRRVVNLKSAICLVLYETWSV